MTYAICFVKHFWISLFIFLQHVEGYEIKNYCHIIIIDFLYLFSVLNSTQKYGRGRSKRNLRSEGSLNRKCLEDRIIFTTIASIYLLLEDFCIFSMASCTSLSKPINSRKLCPLMYHKVPHITINTNYIDYISLDEPFSRTVSCLSKTTIFTLQ